MSRVLLNDGCSPNPGGVLLDGPCGPAGPCTGVDIPVEPAYTVTVRQRYRSGYDTITGHAQWTWKDVVTGPTIERDTREEFDAVAGFTRVKGVITVLYDGAEEITEAAMVVDSDGVSWRVTSVYQKDGFARLDIDRIDAKPVGEAGS